MPLRTACCFTHLTSEQGWQDPQYCVKKFVDALKDRPINRYAYIPVGTGPKRLLQQSNAQEAVMWFGEMAAEIMTKELFSDTPVLVPFPSSKCDKKTQISKTRRLASAVAFRFEATVADVLRFDEPQLSANSEGGSRDPAVIYSHLRLIGPVIEGRPYVLIDDVLTSGGHLRAGAALLRKYGADVVLAICGVDANQEPQADPFQRVWYELEDFTPIRS